MIRFRLKELLADYSFKQGRRVTLEEVAEATQIHRATLSKIAGPTPSNATTDNLDALCWFFQCKLEELAEYVPGSAPAKVEKRARRTESSDSSV